MSFVTLSAAQAFLGTTDTIQLGRIVGRANAQVKRVAGRSFASGTYTERFDGDLTNSYRVKERPIASVTSVSVTYGGVTTAIDSSQYTFDAENGIIGFESVGPADISNKAIGAPIVPRRGLAAEFPMGLANITVVYVGGIATDSDEYKLVQDVTMDVIQSMWSNQGLDKTAQSVSIGQFSITRWSQAAIDQHIYTSLGSLVSGVL